MGQTIRIRNHISVIFANSIRVFGALVAIFIMNMWDSLGEMSETGMSGEEMGLGWIAGIIVSVCLLMLGIQVFSWARTYIILDDQTLMVEKKTLMNVKNTIGLKNVSNVNLEQTLLDRIFGTSKVKLDTDSFSTADQTDVTIVLKTDLAEAFREELRRRVEACTEGAGEERALYEESVEASEQRENCNEAIQSGQMTKHVAAATVTIKANLKELVMHGLLSMSLLGVIVGIISLVVFVISLQTLLTTQDAGVFSDALYVVGGAGWFFMSAAWKIAGGFLNYANFVVVRQGDKVELHYGMLKKVSYTIPVNRIHAVRCSQTLFARLAKSGMIEILNVGMGDDEGEQNSFFLPYAKLDKIREQLQQLLPEYSEGFVLAEQRQPRAIWKLWIVSVVVYALVGVAAVGCILTLAPKKYLAPGLGYGSLGYLLLGAVLVFVKALDYKTSGVGVGERFLKVVNGYFAKRTVVIRHKDIQFVQYKQNVLAKRYGIQRGIVHILASGLNQVQLFTYCTNEAAERLAENVVKA